MKKLKPETKQKLIKILIIILLIAAIVLAIYLPLKLTGALDKIDSAEKLKEIILQSGAYGYIIFFVLQLLQTTILPIPAVVTTVAGTLVFGPWITFGLSYLSIMLGSLFAFFLGKKVGRRIVVWIAGEKDTLKWEQKLERGKFVYFLMMLFPFFPDDILCLVVGTTNMSYKFFIITNLITRPIAIAATCFFGSGQLIPFSGWGIPVWIVLILIGLTILILSFKFQPQIEEFVMKLASKITRKNTKNKENNEKIEEINDKNTENEESVEIKDKQTDNTEILLEENIGENSKHNPPTSNDTEEN